MAQLTLDLGHRLVHGRDDFFVTSCNADAVDWVDRWPAWSIPGLVLWGPPGSGKSHLAAVWSTRSGAPLVAVDTLQDHEPPEVLGERNTLAIDFGDCTGVPDNLEEPLLHLYNIIAERSGSLLLIARTPPARWNIALADLSSRLRAMLTVSIEPPDDQLLSAILLKQFDDRQLTVTADIMAYLVARMERSFEAVTVLVDAIDREALARRRRITLPLVREVLERETLKNG